MRQTPPALKPMLRASCAAPVGAPIPKEMREHGNSSPVVSSRAPQPRGRASRSNSGGSVSPRWIISRTYTHQGIRLSLRVGVQTK